MSRVVDDTPDKTPGKPRVYEVITKTIIRYADGTFREKLIKEEHFPGWEEFNSQER